MSPISPSEPGLLRSFDSFDHAQSAREALLSAGLPAAAVRIEVLQDEAGPVEGNFLVGNGRPSPDAASRAAPGGGPDAPYEANFAKVVTRGVYLVVVEAEDAAHRAKAETLLAQSPGVDVSGVADQANTPPPREG